MKRENPQQLRLFTDDDFPDRPARKRTKPKPKAGRRRPGRAKAK